MRITELELPVSDVDSVAQWFAATLEQRVEGHRVHIGWSTLILVPANGRPLGGVHIAFNVPDNRFPEAMDWLRARSPLQTNPEGKDYFALPGSWRSQSVYFSGPDGLILELIGRQRLPASPRSGLFRGRELTCISEIGLPCGDVSAMRQQLEAALAIRPLSEPSAAFAPLGDDEGLLILVDATRRWFPEGVDLPNAQGVQVKLAHTLPLPAPFTEPTHGWTLR